MKIQLSKTYKDIISLENLLEAWQEFICGKKRRKDVQEFERNLMANLIGLHRDLINKIYRHSHYTAFNISDPKPRNIHKAIVRDRVLHHAIYRQLYQFFDRTFISDSFSCRNGKGIHKALNRFEEFGKKVGKNNTKTVWVLKGDIRKFFASIDHAILLEMLTDYIPDKSIIWLLEQLVDSFSLHEANKGLPLGNLTSQLFCNIYMNEFDQFVKHKLKTKYYIRYADDFVFLSGNKENLISLTPRVSMFLERELKLTLHPDKVFIKTLASGVDFLGWTHFPNHRVLRKTTGRRMFKRIYIHPTNQTLQSYLGLISHGNAYSVKQKLLNWYGLLSMG